MDSTHTLIDFNFGISQLSGNKTLFLTLLQKFATEYRDSEEKLYAFIEGRNWKEAHLLVHSIKGVAGNLGCVDLDDKSSPLERDMKIQRLQPQFLAAFIGSLRATFHTVSILTSLSKTLQVDQQKQRAELQKALKEAIDELDYKTAIELLDS